MSILSLTFHCTEKSLKDWGNYVDDTLILMVENLFDVDKYIISEVETEMINEGKNHNLLLVFDNAELREQFLENEFVNIKERIETRFGEEVMLFVTFLNPKKAKF